MQVSVVGINTWWNCWVGWYLHAYFMRLQMVFLIKCSIYIPIINTRIPVTAPALVLLALGVVRIHHLLILQSKHLLLNKD